MYVKADGTEVWLRTSSNVPYLSIAGLIETSEDHATVRSRLSRAYERLPGIAADDVFLVQEFAGRGALVFCTRPDKNCALLLLGKFERSRDKRKRCDVFKVLNEVIQQSINDIGRQARSTIHFDVVQPEIAMRLG
ncbi:hypothetical protein ACWGS9_32160 [Bradyrhizobium sp. Arg314]